MLRDDYPNITVISEDSQKALEIKCILLLKGVFSNVLTPDEARRNITDIDLLVIYAERYSSRIISVVNSIKTKCAETKTFFIGDFSSFRNSEFGMCISYADAVNGDCISDILADFLGKSIFYTDDSCITTDLFNDRFVVYRGMKIFLTVTEALLVHFLSRAAIPFTAPEEISRYVEVSESSVPVIINSINGKVKSLLDLPMIKAKRNAGYYIVK